MPKRNDIHSILIIGSGPIVIGQACEFDYSGTQACRALRAEGYRVILVNSNPATIMTDPETAERTYVEPLTPEHVEQIIIREKPDAILPTMGGQTALNLAVALHERGILEKHGVKLIGANISAIKKAEDRELFKQAMQRIGLSVPTGYTVTTVEEAMKRLPEIGLPALIRPSFTLGGTGGSVAYGEEEFRTAVQWGLDASPARQVLVEQSVLGWKEYELEVMRDTRDNVVIICSIENFDPMGVHTGDSITVAPAQTLTDREYQRLRDYSIAIIREIGVETGGSNIQFAVNPEDGRVAVIEMNPRVSRSSALASKATGFPIAKIAAKLAVGLTLDEIRNDITRDTPASFEPVIDYVVTKIPRFAFEKFPGSDDRLTTQMKSVGEVMAIGRTFKESFQKALRGLEVGSWGFDEQDGRRFPERPPASARKELEEALRTPRAGRVWALAEAMRAGFSDEEIHQLAWFDPWFLREIREIVEAEPEIAARLQSGAITALELKRVKAMGFSDKRLAALWGGGKTHLDIMALRRSLGVRPVFKRVDTCAAEFEAYTPYLYSTYEEENESVVGDRPRVIILGGGPNRIGQGIEFDYCCVHAVMALKEKGFETIMVNCNPETVSTDYDTSDKLYFEPLTFEDVMAIIEHERPMGVIVQYGGQTPLKLAVPLEKAGAPVIGTSPGAIDEAEDRKRFAALVDKLGLRQPENGMAASEEEALAAARRIGYPVLVRPSYVLGGRAMQIVYEDDDLRRYMRESVKASPDHPVLVDRFLGSAIEIDVDAACDGAACVVAGIMQHIEEAGVHSGDSACCLPPYDLPPDAIRELERQTSVLALGLGVKGLINVQFAIQDGLIYVLEVNPRASRTVPFVSKATGVQWAKVGARIMAGETLAGMGVTRSPVPSYYSVKEVVLPFIKFPGADSLLGPEMKSTGEVMGIDSTFPQAFARAQIMASNRLPAKGPVFLTLCDADKPHAAELAGKLVAAGYEVLATAGTARLISGAGIPCGVLNKVVDGEHQAAAAIARGEVAAVFNTTVGKKMIEDSKPIRRAALRYGIPYVTTLAGIRAAVSAMTAPQAPISVMPLQERHLQLRDA
ncbi:MAG: Carbamoyl-phosphate synthase large chain [Myxococcota bacterium]|nr:Carbamoyl-phosphate synthase large chain [Myxococcota bacterium]